MKALFSITVAVVSFAVSPRGLAAEEPVKTPAQEVAALLEKLPPQSMLDETVALIEKQQGVKMEEARGVVKVAREIVPQLRKLLKVGTSVFDYPGLLAHGRISYQTNGKRADGSSAGLYRLYIGVRAGEFPHPWDVDIFFNDKGTITAIKGVDWKK